MDADSDGAGNPVRDEPSGKHKAPLRSFDDVELGGLPPIAPDGGFMPGPIGVAPSVPDATPDTFVCLRGPCRYYWEVRTFFASGNPKETWGDDGLKDEGGNPLEEPTQITRTCIAHLGTETDFTDDAVFDCNKWDPLTPREVRRIEKRREKYYRIRKKGS